MDSGSGLNETNFDIYLFNRERNIRLKFKLLHNIIKNSFTKYPRIRSSWNPDSLSASMLKVGIWLAGIQCFLDRA